MPQSPSKKELSKLDRVVDASRPLFTAALHFVTFVAFWSALIGVTKRFAYQYALLHAAVRLIMADRK